MKFKVGDIVKRITGQHHGMKIGDVGTIMSIQKYSGYTNKTKYSITIKEFGKEGINIWHDSTRFVRVDQSSSSFLDDLKFNEDNYYG